MDIEIWCNEPRHYIVRIGDFLYDMSPEPLSAKGFLIFNGSEIHMPEWRQGVKVDSHDAPPSILSAIDEIMRDEWRMKVADESNYCEVIYD